MEIEFLKPDLASIKYISEHMRQCDIDEVWSSRHHTPYESLIEGWEKSHFSSVVSLDGVPCAMLGLVISDIASGKGVPWLLGTDDSLNYKKCFLKLAPGVLNQMLNICPKLFNYVHAENISSVAWLKRIGFSIDDAMPHGASGDDFHKFHLQRGS